MKQPKLSDLAVDRKGTNRMRIEAARAKKIKITINIDQDSLESLRTIAGKTGASYQKFLNQILKDGLKSKEEAASRLDRLEKELEKLKKRIAA